MLHRTAQNLHHRARKLQLVPQRRGVGKLYVRRTFQVWRRGGDVRLTAKKGQGPDANRGWNSIGSQGVPGYIRFRAFVLSAKPQLS